MRKLTIVISLITVVCLTLFAAPTVKANEDVKTVAVFIDYPGKDGKGMRDEKCNKLLNDKIIELFPSQYYKPLSLDEVQLKMRDYREDNGLSNIQTLTKSQVTELAKILECDYILYLKFENNNPKISTSLFSSSIKIDLTCSYRWMDVEKNEYTGNKQITKESISSRNADKIYFSALEKILPELTLDTIF